MPPDQPLINDVEQLLVFQYLIGLTHPGFPKIAHCVFQKAFAESGLTGAEMNRSSRSTAPEPTSLI
jgi:hypothetical protein